MNRRQALLSRRVVRFCKPSLVEAIKDTIPEDAPVTIPLCKAERPSLIDLTDYPDHQSTPRRYHRRVGRRGRRGATGETSEKHIDLTDQGEDDRPTKEQGIISVATLSPNAMMLKRRAAANAEEPPSSPKLSYGYRRKSPARPERVPREQRVEVEEHSGNKGRDHREANHTPERRRAWKRLFIDKSAMEATQANSKDTNQDFLSAFSYEFKHARKDTDGEHSDIIVLDDILPSQHKCSAQLPVASPYHASFGSTAQETASQNAPTTGRTNVRRADMTHATQLHLQKQAARIEYIRQRAKELQQERRARPTPEWRPERLVDFASQSLQGKTSEKQTTDETYSWLSAGGRKALRYRKARKAADPQHQELSHSKSIDEESTHEVTREGSTDAMVELESVVSNEADNHADQAAGNSRLAIDCTSIHSSAHRGEIDTQENKETLHLQDTDSAPTSPVADKKSMPVSPSLDKPLSSPQCSVESPALSPHSPTTRTTFSGSSFAPQLSIDTNMEQNDEPHFVSPEENPAALSDRAGHRSSWSPDGHQGRMSALPYISPVSDTDCSQTHGTSPRSIDASPRRELALSYSLSGPEEPTVSSKEKILKSTYQPLGEKSVLEPEDDVEESREPEQSHQDRRDADEIMSYRESQSPQNSENEHSFSGVPVQPKTDYDRREMSPVGARDDFNEGENETSQVGMGRHDELDLPQCLTESTRHGLDAIDADNGEGGSSAGSPRLSIVTTSTRSSPRDSPRNKTDDVQVDDQSYSSWSIKPKVSFPSIDVFDKPFDECSPRNEGNGRHFIETNAMSAGEDIGDIEEVNTSDLITIMEEATSEIKTKNQELDRTNYPEQEYSPHRPIVVFHDGESGDDSPQVPTHDKVRRSRFSTPVISPKSTKSTDTSTSGDNAVESDFYQVDDFRESFDSLEYGETNAYRICAAPPLIYQLLDSACIWLEGIHCFFCFQAPLFQRPKKRGKKSKVQGLGNSTQVKKIARPSSPRGEGSVSSRRRSQSRTRSSDERSKRSSRSSTRSAKERRSQRSRGENHVHFSSTLTEQQHANYMNIEMT